ncbi:heme o synthase [Aliiglaciecola litoralis]|uniref:Protoheme IX farnesyltransferase n=2 Tax=Aliiglaciecola litoralis TaxID=582857 RepID=A0ABP3WLI3_9ALTE
MIGYGLGVSEFNLLQCSGFLIGTLLTALGANALNQCWERQRDGLMARTRNRPLPTGMLSLFEALTVALMSSLVGVAILWFLVNPLTSALGVLTLVTYLLLYTPIKPISPAAVLVGAIPGAIPPIMGWSAATNTVSIPALVLGFVLFLWQIPHFMALASIYKIDYQKGGYQLLPDDPAIDKVTRSIIVVFSLALLSISLLAPAAGLGHSLFLVSALILGGALLFLSVQFYRKYSIENARNVFRASIIYLPVLLTILLIDQRVLIA